MLYTVYLFFDFAGYSAMAVGLEYNDGNKCSYEF